MSYQPKVGDRVRVSKELVVTESHLDGDPETRRITDGNNLYWLDTWDVEKAADTDVRSQQMSNVFTGRLRIIADAMGAIPNCPKHTPECPPAPWESCPECETAAKRDAATDALASMWVALDADAKFNR